MWFIKKPVQATLTDPSGPFMKGQVEGLKAYLLTVELVNLLYQVGIPLMKHVSLKLKGR